jgi:ABC-2 type transport system ATP-binding protein
MQTNPTPARLNGVTKRYGSVLALDGVSLTIGSGELVAMLGSNGAGKTTAVKILLGLIPPTSGSAEVFGCDPRRPLSRVRTGAMLQVGKVPETLRVREHIALFSSYYPHPLSSSAVTEAAGLIGLENRLFGELSGGEKQRVLFALALCGDPDLLILDEPTVGLDVTTRRAMWEQIRRFVDRGRSILLTTHYLAEADALADRVVVIDRGEIVAEGTPQQIKAGTAGKRIRCTTSLGDAAIKSLIGVASVARQGTTVEIVTASGDATVRALLALDPDLRDLEISSTGLEDAFLELTQSKEVA